MNLWSTLKPCHSNIDNSCNLLHLCAITTSKYLREISNKKIGCVNSHFKYTLNTLSKKIEEKVETNQSVKYLLNANDKFQNNMSEEEIFNSFVSWENFDELPTPFF